MKKIVDFFIHFFRRILFFLTQIIGTIICLIIFLITFEPKSGKNITRRKIKRIRRLTKFKLWLWEHFYWYFNFIHDDAYYKILKERLG